MNILILYGSNDRYGASQVLINEVETLITLGYQVNLMVPFEGPISNILAQRKIEARVIINSGMSVLRKSRLLDAFKIKIGWNWIAEADLVVVWTLALVSYVPALIFLKKKFYISIHEYSQAKLLKYIVRLLIVPFKYPVQVNSHAVFAWLQKNGVRDGRIFLAYPFFSQQKTPRLRTVSPINFGVVGRVNGAKGHLEVCRAFSNSKLGTDASLHLYGAPFPGQEEALEKLMRFAQRDSRIFVHREFTRFSEVSKSFDLLLCFPRYQESFGLTPIEAYFEGIRVAGYGDGGSKEVFDLVDGISIQRSGDIEKDIMGFFQSINKNLIFSNWNPDKDGIATNFSKENRIERVKLIISKVFDS